MCNLRHCRPDETDQMAGNLAMQANMAGARVQRGTVSEAINIVGAQQDPIATAVGVVRAAQQAYAVEPPADGADLQCSQLVPMNVSVQQNFIAAPPAAALPLAAARQPAMAARTAAMPMPNAAPMANSWLGTQLQALAAALPADSEQLKTMKLALLSNTLDKVM